MMISASVGANHCGSLDSARRHIEVAKMCGAGAIDFQLYRVDSLDSRGEVKDRLKPFEIPLSWLPALKDCAKRNDLKLIITPFSEDMAEAARGYADMVKVSSGDLTFDSLVRKVASLGVPVILSTAMASMKEIGHALRLISSEKGSTKIDVTLLHGVAAPLAEPEMMNLKVIRSMANSFAIWGCSVGLEDHTLGHEAAVLATALGAKLIEKHFRIYQAGENPDYHRSITPFALRDVVDKVMRAKIILGFGDKAGPLREEMDIFLSGRRTDKKRLRGYF